MTRPLDDSDLTAAVLALDPDLRQTAVWAHLLQDKLATGEITFPVESLAGLDPLFVIGEQTTGTDHEAPISLRRPGESEVPPGVFPIENMTDFVRKAYAVIQFVHTLTPPDQIHFQKMPR